MTADTQLTVRDLCTRPLKYYNLRVNFALCIVFKSNYKHINIMPNGRIDKCNTMSRLSAKNKTLNNI